MEQAYLLEQEEELSFLESRHYRWECGCSQEKLMAVLAPSMKSQAEDLFGPESSLRLSCPRCGARHLITRETLEAFLRKAS